MSSTNAAPAVGVTVGARAVTGAPVDLGAGRCTADRVRLPMPSPATPEAVAEVVDAIPELLAAPGPVGVALPATVRGDVVEQAPDLGPSWSGVDALTVFARRSDHPVAVINDGDAAGIAEMRYGAGRGRCGLVVFVGLDGIGSALFLDGKLVPNTDLAPLLPHYAPAARDPSWKRYASELVSALGLVERLLSPRLIVLSGRTDELLRNLPLRTEIVPALLQREAPIVGAALSASATESRTMTRVP